MYLLIVSLFVISGLSVNDFGEIASKYVQLISTKPLPMEEIKSMETSLMQKSMTEKEITTMMAPFKTFDRILYSKENNESYPGYKVYITAARFKYTIKEQEFYFNLLFRIPILMSQPIPLVDGVKAIYNWTCPTYANTSLFYEVTNLPIGPLSLPGILTIPNFIDKPLSVVLLIAGSGQGDADESFKGMKPFKDLAWGLATQGIAVLRFPKRYHLYPAKRKNETIEEEYMIDTESAIDILYDRFSQLVVPIAHSEGGRIVPLLTQRKINKIAGFVTLASMVQHFVASYIRQAYYIAKVYNHTLTPKQLEEIKKMQDVETLLEEGKLPDDYILPIGLSMVNPTYLNVLFKIDTVGITNNLPPNKHFLVTNGDKDYQVTLDTDFNVWKKNNKNENVKFRVFEDVDHFQNLVEGVPAPWDYDTPQNVLKEIVDVVSDFIIKISR